MGKEIKKRGKIFRNEGRKEGRIEGRMEGRKCAHRLEVTTSISLYVLNIFKLLEFSKLNLYRLHEFRNLYNPYRFSSFWRKSFQDTEI
jgi:predicted transposase YdaD